MDKQQVSQGKLLLPSCDCPLHGNQKDEAIVCHYVSCQGHSSSGTQSLNAVFIR